MGKTNRKAHGFPSLSVRVVAGISEADIMDACRAGDLTKLQRFGRQGVRVKTVKPLYIAAVEGGSVDVVRCLVTDLGADVNQVDAKFFTPLYIAAQSGNRALVQCLVNELGADVNQGDIDGVTALFIAAQKGFLDIVGFLAGESGADANQAMHGGATPLCIAIQQSHMDIVRCLVTDFGADVNQARQDGATPLMMAAIRKNQALIKHLVHKGAHVRAVATDGTTAITYLKMIGATAAQIAYLEVRECCANPGCDGGGRKRCCVCKETRYCGMACRVAHWRVHREGCRPPIDAESKGSGGAS
jgi:ankyrin repeat protein